MSPRVGFVGLGAMGSPMASDLAAAGFALRAVTTARCGRTSGVPTEEIIMNFPWWRKILGKMMLRRMEGKFDLEEGYNLEAAKLIKPVIGEVPLLIVGGMRKVSQMEEVLNRGFADFISMSRPFIREPNIVTKIREGKADSVACVSCNECFAAVANNLPVYCYNKGLPNR